MLVLTTMFISVSNNLPTTAYVKMIDVWLIFNLLLPFILVLLHTYMDSLRTETNQEEGEQRTINHHGKTVTVGGDTPNMEVKLLFFMMVVAPYHHHHPMALTLTCTDAGEVRTDPEPVLRVPQVFPQQGGPPDGAVPLEGGPAEGGYREVPA